MKVSVSWKPKKLCFLCLWGNKKKVAWWMGGCIAVLELPNLFKALTLCCVCFVMCINLTVCVILFAILTSRRVYCVSISGGLCLHWYVPPVRNGCLHLTAGNNFCWALGLFVNRIVSLETEDWPFLVTFFLSYLFCYLFCYLFA